MLVRNRFAPASCPPDVNGSDDAFSVDQSGSRTVARTATETPGYLKVPGGSIYFVHHGAHGTARGTVLLCGPIALEACHSALVWTRWARTLASAGWNAVRFDWRGSGESTARFSEMTFRDWESDLRVLCDAIADTSGAPIVLLGLRAGALLAANAFATLEAAALVLWEAPSSGRAHLTEVLRRKLAADYALGTQVRKTRDEYIAEIASGGTVEVEGFPWTRDLWEGFGDLAIPACGGDRPMLRISTRTHRIERPFWQDALNLRPDTSEWFNATLQFLNDLDRGWANRNSPPLTTTATFGRIERRVLVLQQSGARLVATHHVSRTPSKLGLLFGNFGYVPRCGQAGLAARICDELAEVGVHGFRLDLPALGDADGELPEDPEEWFQSVRAGSMVRPIGDAMETLSRVHGIDKFVVGGLCAAAITAIFALERHPHSIAGLMLLEPEFFTGEKVPRLAASNGAGHSLSRRLLSDWAWMRLVARESVIGRRIPIPRHLVRRLLDWRGDKLPARTNLPLAAAWQSAVRRRVPILVVTAQGKMREVFFDRMNAVAIPHYDRLVGEGRVIQHARIAETNHTFTTGAAIERINQLARDWLTTVIPPSARSNARAQKTPTPIEE